jgi:hypothetical protein
VPQDPLIDWLTTDPDSGSLIRIKGTWVNLGSLIRDESLRLSISQRLINYYEKLYVNIISEDGFGSSDLISDLDYLKDTITAWRLWGLDQAVYADHSALWAAENVKEYGTII